MSPATTKTTPVLEPLPLLPGHPREVVTSEEKPGLVALGSESSSEGYYTNLYLVLRPSLVANLRQKGLSVEDLEDVIQEAFLRLIHRAPKDLQPDSVRYWLLRVAYNLVIDLRRSEQNCFLDTRVVFDHVISAIPSKAFNPEELYLYSEKWQSHEFEISPLTPRQRQAMHLRISGLSHKDIAAHLKTTIHNVEELIRRGLKRLARHRPKTRPA